MRDESFRKAGQCRCTSAVASMCPRAGPPAPSVALREDRVALNRRDCVLSADQSLVETAESVSSRIGRNDTTC
jgi:hypothetical protein